MIIFELRFLEIMGFRNKEFKDVDKHLLDTDKCNTSFEYHKDCNINIWFNLFFG